MTFNLEQHRAQRNTELQRHNDYLEGELQRTYTLLADLLQLAADHAHINPLELLQALCARANTNPAKAHIHQDPPFLQWLALENLEARQ